MPSNSVRLAPLTVATVPSRSKFLSTTVCVNLFIIVLAPAILGLPSGKPIAYFKFSPDTLNNYVEDAILRFYVKKPENVITDSTILLHVRVYSVDDRSGRVILQIIFSFSF